MKKFKVLHGFIILNFAVEIIYSVYMLFVALGSGGPLFARVNEISFEMLVSRRLYAIEAWIAITGLSLYLAITEIAPRRKQEKSAAELPKL